MNRIAMWRRPGMTRARTLPQYTRRWSFAPAGAEQAIRALAGLAKWLPNFDALMF